LQKEKWLNYSLDRAFSCYLQNCLPERISTTAKRIHFGYSLLNYRITSYYS